MVEINESFEDKNEDKDKEIDIAFEEIGEGLRARRPNNLVSLTVSRISSLASKPLLQRDKVLEIV